MSKFFAFNFDALPLSIHGASIVTQLNASDAVKSAAGVSDAETSGHGLVAVLAMLAFGSISYKANPWEKSLTKRGKALKLAFGKIPHVKVKHGTVLARADLQQFFDATVKECMLATDKNGALILGERAKTTPVQNAPKTDVPAVKKTDVPAVIMDRWGMPLSSTIARFDKLDDVLSSGAMIDEITNWVSTPFSNAISMERNRFDGVQSAQIAHEQRLLSDQNARAEKLMHDRTALETVLRQMGDAELKAIMAKLGYRVSKMPVKVAA